MDMLTFNCPRCTTAVTERFYGPCEACRLNLRELFPLRPRNVHVDEYEPKMNVTPNAVAIKESD